MKHDVAIPAPALRFPEAGWLERLVSYVRAAGEKGLELEAHLEPGASAETLAAAPAVQGALRDLLAAANGGRIGHLHILAASAIGPAPLRFANDLAGSWRFAPGEPHEVVLECRDGPDEHRFTNLGTFLDASFVRAYADASHRKAEVDAGDDLDDRPWVDAARALELRIDPKMIRTRED
jgi:hypothetical protein